MCDCVDFTVTEKEGQHYGHCDKCKTEFKVYKRGIWPIHGYSRQCPHAHTETTNVTLDLEYSVYTDPYLVCVHHLQCTDCGAPFVKRGYLYGSDGVCIQARV